MGFDLKKFKQQGLVNDGQRTNLFSLECAELPRLAFMVSRLEWVPGDSLSFSMLEDEGMTSFDMLRKLRDDKPQVTIKFHSRDGENVVGFTEQPLEVQFKIAMDWAADNDLAKWDVEMILA